MSINLNQKEGITITGPEFNAIADNLQSNILKSHSRDNARLLFLKFTAGTADISRWVKDFISQERFVVTARQQAADSKLHNDTGAPSKTLANFYLSSTGYEHLGKGTNQFTDDKFDNDDEDKDEADEVIASFGNNDFVRGMKSKKVNKKLEDPALDKWDPAYTTDIHAMILLADDTLSRLVTETGLLKTSLTGIAEIVKEEVGINLTAPIAGKKRNIEHFGYADGVSQPTFFSDDKNRIPSPDGLQPLNIILVKDPLTDKDDNNYGSFLVYRKLAQDVEGFNNKVAQLAPSLQLNANQAGKITTEDFAGALAVGRYKDGTPLIKSDIPLAQVPAFNDFKYEDTDRPAHKCPFHAHIRKVNPRGQGILVGKRFITRRAIPYGKQGSAEEKGLLFMCFQSNLERQFNFIQKTWANAPRFPPFRDKPGIDPLIGQGDEGNQSWPIEYNSEKEVDFNFAGFIRMMGGEYFFAPSIGFLRDIETEIAD